MILPSYLLRKSDEIQFCTCFKNPVKLKTICQHIQKLKKIYIYYYYYLFYFYYLQNSEKKNDQGLAGGEDSSPTIFISGCLDISCRKSSLDKGL
jgi:hypothetical protein